MDGPHAPRGGAGIVALAEDEDRRVLADLILMWGHLGGRRCVPPLVVFHLAADVRAPPEGADWLQPPPEHASLDGVAGAVAQHAVAEGVVHAQALVLLVAEPQAHRLLMQPVAEELHPAPAAFVLLHLGRGAAPSGEGRGAAPGGEGRGAAPSGDGARGSAGRRGGRGSAGRRGARRAERGVGQRRAERGAAQPRAKTCSVASFVHCASTNTRPSAASPSFAPAVACRFCGSSAGNISLGGMRSHRWKMGSSNSPLTAAMAAASWCCGTPASWRMPRMHSMIATTATDHRQLFWRPALLLGVLQVCREDHVPHDAGDVLEDAANALRLDGRGDEELVGRIAIVLPQLLQRAVLLTAWTLCPRL